MVFTRPNQSEKAPSPAHNGETNRNIYVHTIHTFTAIQQTFSVCAVEKYTVFIYILDRRTESICQVATTLLGTFTYGSWERFQYGLTILKPIILCARGKKTYFCENEHTYKCRATKKTQQNKQQEAIVVLFFHLKCVCVCVEVNM